MTTKTDFLTRLERVQKSHRLAAKTRKAAAGPNIVAGADWDAERTQAGAGQYAAGRLASRDHNPKDEENGVILTQDFAAPLAKSFEGLARKYKNYRYLGVDRILQDPQHYLREKDARGNYKVTDGQLGGIIEALLVSGARGRSPDVVDYETWAANRSKAIGAKFEALASKGVGTAQQISKALDTTSGAPLIRTDLEPVIYEAYLRDFPGLEAVRYIPSNGLTHTYNQRTSPGSASWISELGDLSGTFSNSTYSRKTNSNIGVLVAPRGISLKVQFAVSQSGMTSYDLQGDQNLEIMGAAYAMAKSNQAKFFQGNESQSGGTLSDENGSYDVNTYDGARLLLKGSGTSLTKATSDTYRVTLNKAVGEIINAGGQSRNLMVFTSLGVRLQINEEMMPFLRLNDAAPGGGFPSNLSANGFVTIGDWLAKLMDIPADGQDNGIGYYTYNAATVEDIYVMDMSQLAMAYLGSPSITVLELPIGYNNQLSNVFIPFLMNGLVMYIPAFNRKVRVPQQTV